MPGRPTNPSPDRQELLVTGGDRLERLMQQLLAVQRHLAARAVERGQQQRRGRGRAHDADRPADGAGIDTPAVADVQHRALR
jgi:hypothetical protein